VDAEALGRMLNLEKIVVVSTEKSVLGLDSEAADKIKDLVETVVPAEEFEGYIALDGEYIVFSKKKGAFVAAIVEEGKVRWCLKKLGEVMDGS